MHKECREQLNIGIYVLLTSCNIAVTEYRYYSEYNHKIQGKRKMIKDSMQY